MKISIVAHGAHGGRGGIDLYIANLIDALIESSNVQSINLYTKKKIKLKKKNITKKYSSNSINFLIMIFVNLINILKSDIIIISHINLLPFLTIPILFKRKVVLLSYGLEIWGEEKNLFYKYIIKKINYFICMRLYTMKKLKKMYKLNDKKYFLLSNCIKIKKLTKLNKNNKNIITVARLDAGEKFKGVDETLEAISLHKNINFKYFVVGDGDDKKRLKNKAKDLNIKGNVIFFGKVSNKVRSYLLSKSHIISMPGSDKTFDTYPFRFIFLEAAEFGLKIIASHPSEKNELDSKKRYNNINFVNPNNKVQILKKILQLQKQKKKYDLKYLNDFSFNNFKNNLYVIISKIL